MFFLFKKKQGPCEEAAALLLRKRGASLSSPRSAAPP